jgi:ferrochelatase
VEKVKVICPGFSADCLETLEEIKEENKEYFLTAGGKSFEYIPALNDNNKHIELLSAVILKN